MEKNVWKYVSRLIGCVLAPLWSPSILHFLLGIDWRKYNYRIGGCYFCCLTFSINISWFCRALRECECSGQYCQCLEVMSLVFNANRTAAVRHRIYLNLRLKRFSYLIEYKGNNSQALLPYGQPQSISKWPF